MKYYIQVLSKWYAFLCIFISCQIFFPVVNKKGLRGKGDERKFKITTRSGRSVYLQDITMIDPTIGLIELHTLQSARADLVANQVELSCLTRYPLPNKVIVDRGIEFLVSLEK